jgi:hypothetical protein
VPSQPTARTRSPRETSRLIVIPLAVAAAIGASYAGCHPTGTAIADPIETAAFAAGFTVLTSRSSRGTWLVLGVAAVLLSRGWLLVPAAVTMAGAFSTVFSTQSRRRFGAAIGALGVQVVLRWPSELFHGFPSLAAMLVVVIVGASVWRRSSRRIRRRALIALGGLGAAAVVVSLPALVATLMVRNEALAAESATHLALSTIGSGSPATVTTELRAAAADSSNAAGALDFWVAMGARIVPLVAQQDRFLAGTFKAAAQAAAVGAGQAPAIDYHRLGYHDGQLDLDRLRAMGQPMELLDRQLRITDRQLAGVDSPWLVWPLQQRAGSFRGDVGRALHGANLAVQAARVLPGMLGGDGTRTYLLAFMTPSESRGYDGLIASYGVLSASNGRVRLSVSGSITNIEDALPSGGAILSGPADFLARYGSFDPGKYPQDASFSPDLPTVASVLDQIYAQAGGAPVDGVLALDPYGLADLLHFTGPVQVAGLPFPLTQQNAARVLLSEQYTTFDTGATNADVLRHDFLQGALHSTFNVLVNGSLPSPRTVSSVLDPAVVDGRISFWSFHPSEQPFLRNLGIDGSFPTTDNGDLEAVTTQNTGPNKIDAYLHTSVLDQLTFDPSTGHLSSVVTITLKNDAPTSGLPGIVIDSPDHPGLPPGTNRTWLTLYSPLAFTRVSIGGRSATMSSTAELGVHAYSTYVDVPSDGTTRIRVELTGQVAPGDQLPVSVRLQPSANPQRSTVEVTPAGGWSLANTAGSDRWLLSSAFRQIRTFRFVPS